MKLKTKKAEEKTTRGMNSKSHKRLRIITVVLLNVLGIWCVSGNVVPCVIAFHVLFFFFSLQYSCKAGAFIIIHNLETRKSKHREAEDLGQTHTAYLWQHKDSKLGDPVSEPALDLNHWAKV